MEVLNIIGLLKSRKNDDIESGSMISDRGLENFIG